MGLPPDELEEELDDDELLEDELEELLVLELDEELLEDVLLLDEELLDVDELFELDDELELLEEEELELDDVPPPQATSMSNAAPNGKRVFFIGFTRVTCIGSFYCFVAVSLLSQAGLAVTIPDRKAVTY